MEVNYYENNLVKEMKVICPKCGKSDFSVVEYRFQTFHFNKGKNQLIKYLNCDWCGTLFLVRIEIERTDVESDFIVTQQEEI